MKINYVALALVTVVNLFSGESPYRCQMSGNALEADIIVIGAGAAGCIVMKELSEQGFSVLGIEGGLNLVTDPEIEAVGLPSILLASTGRSKYFWPGWNQTVPMAGLNGRTSDWTTGMILGGGSSINGLVYVRGSNPMYSRWEGISGSSNWSLDNILATFKELENYHSDPSNPVSPARGTEGLLSVLQTAGISNLATNVLLPASHDAFTVPFGIPVVTDYNDPSVVNCIDPETQWFINSAGTKRASSATAYLNSSVMTPEGQGVNGHKLFMQFNAVAVKILFDEDGNAKKVQYFKDGQLLEARANKAVVLASGINSSKILQLSGIGPADVLANAGIAPVFINENVGKHLQNHPLIYVTMPVEPLDPNYSGLIPGAPYAFTLQNVYLPVQGGGASDPRMLQILFEYVPPGLLLIGFELLNPVSEGSVSIQSDNSFQIAAADDAFYQNPIDLDNMKYAVQHYIGALLDQLETYGAAPLYRPFPCDPIIAVRNSGYDSFLLGEYVKNNSNSSLDVHHFTSHCKMAALNAGGVVDGDTRVYGTKNVFVVDNSICPVIPDGNTAAPAMMIGLRSSKILQRVLKK